MSRQLREQIVAVLGSLPRGFGFVDGQAGGYYVTYTALRNVANAVRNGAVRVVEATAASATYSGRYNARSDTFTIHRNQIGLRRESVIVHEAVHCLHDVWRLRIARPYNEIATNIAENMYRRLMLQGNAAVAPPPGAIDRAADRVVQRLLGIADVRRRIVRVSDRDVRDLVSALHDSSYGDLKGTTFVGNGV